MSYYVITRSSLSWRLLEHIIVTDYTESGQKSWRNSMGLRLKKKDLHQQFASDAKNSYGKILPTSTLQLLRSCSDRSLNFLGFFP